MKKTIAIGAALMLTLSACATDGSTSSFSQVETKATPTTYVTQDYEAPPAVMAEPKTPARSASDEKVDRMIEILSVFPEQPSRRDFLKDFAEVTCEGLDTGVSLERQVILSLDYDFGYSQTTMGGVFGAAVMTHCPEHYYQVEDFMEKY